MCAFRFSIGLLLLPVLGSFLACGDPSSQSTSDAARAYPLVVVSATALRAAASERSPELEQLPAGARLYEEGVVSDFLASIRLRDTLWQEPWLKVQTAKGRSGWVFAATVRPPESTPAQAETWALDKRFQALFGPGLAQRRRSWSALPAPATDTAFAALLQEGLALRDSLNLLTGRMLTRDETSPLPDLYWMNALSPYFLVQRVRNGTSYALFLDFRAVARTAAGTPGQEDDLFAQLGFAAYPTDSIESALPVWVFPIGTEESCSNLGQGQHLRLLRTIDAALRRGGLFRIQHQEMKDRILNDILDKSRDYWQPKEKILTELSAILRERPRCLNDRDVLALEARLHMFASPETNGIRVDARSGK